MLAGLPMPGTPLSPFEDVCMCRAGQTKTKDKQRQDAVCKTEVLCDAIDDVKWLVCNCAHKRSIVQEGCMCSTSSDKHANTHAVALSILIARETFEV